MTDYAKLYRREHRIRVVREEQLRRVKKAVRVGLPKTLTLLLIAFIVRRVN